MNDIIKRNGISYGVIIGVVLSLIITLMYLIDLSLFTAWWISLINFICFFSLAIWLLMTTKQEMGTITFKEAFTTYFIYTVIGLFITSLFSVLLFEVIDPAAKDSVMEHVIRFTEDTLAKHNIPQATINEKIAEIKAKKLFSLATTLESFVFGLLAYSVVGLIMAAIFKSKPPQEIR